jgi:DNA-binding MarR family transcriptional regulator
MKIFKTGELVGKTSRLLSRNLSNHLSQSKTDITSEQWIILRILTQGSKNQKELSEITLKTKATINSLISYLLKSEFIIKTISKSDKRNIEISISSKGLQIIKQTNISALNSIVEATNGFSKEEIMVLNNYLMRIQNNLLKK